MKASLVMHMGMVPDWLYAGAAALWGGGRDGAGDINIESFCLDAALSQVS